jgi:hypothetical protein
MSADADLAYVFWHLRQPQVARSEYEENHFAFHRALQTNAPPGFRGARVQRLSRAPWLTGTPPAEETYEDWYYLDDSAALDRINEAAVSGTRRGPHDRVARLAAAGVAGLYRLRHGVRAVRTRQALWFSKPADLSYAALFERFAARGSGEALWMRQMTLGPTTEFCLHTDGNPPEGLSPSTSLRIDAIWEFPKESP